ncbi:MAG TPA: fibronectin type III domain-containing protein [Magnetospirillaceae bacterium]
MKFTIKGAGFSPENMGLVACFRWKADKQAVWIESPQLRLLDSSVAGAVTFAATVPSNLSPARWGWLSRIIDHDGGESTGFAIVPIADFRVMAKSTAIPGAAWSPVDVVVPVGITSLPFATLADLFLIVVAGGILYRFGLSRGVPGGRNPFLIVISTRGGYASLSQLQIVMWSFVIGASAIYVMALSGNLIGISQGTLILLGISGVATLGSKLQSGSETPATQSAPSSIPGTIIGLSANGPPSESDVRLSWAAPIDGGQTVGYTVQYRTGGPAPGNWLTYSRSLTQTEIRVMGLDQNTLYEFQVAATNAAGTGAFATTTASTQLGQAPALGLAPVGNLRPTGLITNSKIRLTWDVVAGANSYRVQYRVHSSDNDWTTVRSENNQVQAAGLRANTLYDIRVAALTASGAPGNSNVGPWFYIQASTIGPRIPKWSDLVIANDSENEIDVTRVQMLFFTVVVALFVALRVVVVGEIPEIPEGFLLLMGISNGVYLTAKFVPG